MIHRILPHSHWLRILRSNVSNSYARQLVKLVYSANFLNQTVSILQSQWCVIREVELFLRGLGPMKELSIRIQLGKRPAICKSKKDEKYHSISRHCSHRPEI